MKTLRLIPLVLICAGALLAQGPRGGRGPGGPADGQRGGMIPGALREELALTDQQITQIKDLARKQFESQKPKRDAMRTASTELQELLKSPNPDPTAVGQKTLALRQMREEMKNAHVSLGDQIKSVLTPDQLNRLKNLESTSKTIPAARQARMLGLIPGGDEAGPGGRGMMMNRGGRFPMRRQ